MNILLIGNGGREHALAWKISQSILTSNLFVAPGNAGTAQVGTNINIKSDDLEGIGRLCLEKKIDLLIVGPEAPLVLGIRDYFERTHSLQHVLIVGPGKIGAQLEGSKDFSKQFMVRHGVPTAKAKTFTEAELSQGLAYLETCSFPIVLKADGLAAGKGVLICDTLQNSRNALTDMLGNKLFGAASERVLIEEFLTGMELSVFILTDGKNYVLLPEAKDYKRIGDGDEGPNTGGMGAVSPVPFANSVFMEKVRTQIIEPTLSGLEKENIPYKGFIFFGLIKVGDEPFVIEYNARMGDPESEAVVPRIQTDLVQLLMACAKGSLDNSSINISPEHAVTVVMVSGGYPGEYSIGKEIVGLEQQTNALCFHAGTTGTDQRIYTNGGRVLAVTATGADIQEARTSAYQSISGISYAGMYFRKDIGVDLLQIEK